MTMIDKARRNRIAALDSLKASRSRPAPAAVQFRSARRFAQGSGDAA